MLRVLLGLAFGALLSGLSATSGGAKTPAYVIAGGELGPYAVHFHDTREDGPFTQALEQTAPPEHPPPLSYDLYTSSGNLAVPYQMAQGQPWARYYPEARLLEYPRPGLWYRVPPRDAAFLDGVVIDAMASKRRGELDIGPVAADFRARNLDRVTYWLRPMAAVALDDTYFASQPFSCAGLYACFTVTRSGDEFIMRDLIETLRTSLRRPDGTRAAFIIEYYGIVEPPYGGIGGVLGFYTPPRAGEPGRFWYDGYFHDQSTPFHETTPAFDAAIAQALGLADESKSSAGSRTTLAGAGAALLTAMFGAGLVRRLAGRRG